MVPQPLLIILPPALDQQILLFQFTKRRDKSAGEAGIGDQRDVVVDGRAADIVVVVQLGAGKVLGDVDYQLDGFAAEVIQDIWFGIFVRPVSSFSTICYKKSYLMNQIAFN